MESRVSIAPTSHWEAWREKENCLQGELYTVLVSRRKKDERPADGRSSDPAALRLPVPPTESQSNKLKKAAHTCCKTLTPRADDSNELELRTRSDEATTTRCRKEKLRMHLRCNSAATSHVVDRSVHSQAYIGIVSHFTVSRASGLLETAARPGRAKIVAEISCFCAQRVKSKTEI